MNPSRQHRVSLKAHHPKWKEQLRQNCLKIVQIEREKLLQKIRSQGDKPFPLQQEDKMDSTVRNIVSEEIQKMEALPLNEKENDQIWEHKDQFGNVTESEEALLEMERLLYQELREELTRRGLNTEETTKHVQDWMPINMDEIPLQSVPPTNTPMLTGTMVPDLTTGIVSGGRASYD